MEENYEVGTYYPYVGYLIGLQPQLGLVSFLVDGGRNDRRWSDGGGRRLGGRGRGGDAI